MNNFKVKNPRKDLTFEIEFTKSYRDAVKKYDNPYQIEVECLKAQFPAALHAIQDEDLIAGRLQMGLVGLGIQGQTGGFGYYINEEKVTQELEFGLGDAKYREDLHDLLTFWKSRNSTEIVLRNTPEDIKPALFSNQWKTLPLPASPIIRMAGAFIDYDKLLLKGLCGIADEIIMNRKNAEQEGRDLLIYDCMLQELELVKDVCLFYENQAEDQIKEATDAKRRKQLIDIASALKNIRDDKPKTMLEALQLSWIYGLLIPVLEHGRLDEYIGDFYVHDIDNGIIIEDEALEMVKSFFRLVDHMDSETDGRVIVGGYGRRNPENADRFCPVAIEACRTVKEPLPQFTLRFNKETPERIWDLAMQCIEEGRTYPLLYNDDVLVEGLMKAFDVNRELAETYLPLGCGEIEFDHYSFGSPNGSINLLKILELAIRGGYDPMMGWWIGPKVKGLLECDTYEEFWGSYRTVIDYYIEAQAKYEVYEYDITGKMHPFLLVSILYDGCIKKGKSIFNGGCEYLAGTLEFYGNVNAANSLAAIKKLVFEDKSMTRSHLIEIINENFYRFERERRLLMDAPKYGNDDDYVDSIFTELHDHICIKTKDQASKAGLKSYLAVTINNAQNTTLGRWVGATPDGRKSGTPMANANNPAPGSDKNGVTAMLNSLLKPSHDTHAGMVQNIRFTRELFKKSREKMYGLIENYFERGGAQAMITVVGQNDLKNAMLHPEEYADLIVRVGGFSARFVTLKKDVQQEIYNRVTY